MQIGMGLRKIDHKSKTSVQDVKLYILDAKHKFSYIEIERKDINSKNTDGFLCSVPQTGQKINEEFMSNLGPALNTLFSDFIGPLFANFDCNIKVSFKVSSNGLLGDRIFVEMNYPVNAAIANQPRHTQRTAEMETIHKLLDKQNLLMSKIKKIQVHSMNNRIMYMSLQSEFEHKDFEFIQKLSRPDEMTAYDSDIRRKQVIQKWVEAIRTYRKIHLKTDEKMTATFVKNMDTWAMVLDGIKNIKKL